MIHHPKSEKYGSLLNDCQHLIDELLLASFDRNKNEKDEWGFEEEEEDFVYNSIRKNNRLDRLRMESMMLSPISEHSDTFSNEDVLASPPPTLSTPYHDLQDPKEQLFLDHPQDESVYDMDTFNASHLNSDENTGDTLFFYPITSLEQRPQEILDDFSTLQSMIHPVEKTVDKNVLVNIKQLVDEIPAEPLTIETSEERPQETTDEKALDERKPSNEITASLEIPTESLRIETSEERPQETFDEKVLDERKLSNEISAESYKIEISEKRPQETTDEKALDERKPANEITALSEIPAESLKIKTSEERPQETTDEKVLDERKPSNEITTPLEIQTDSLKIETSEERPQETTDEKVLDERKPSNEITASLEIPTESLKIETSEERPQETTDEKVLDERKPSNEITASLEIPTESLKIETSEERPQETTDEKVLDERKPSNEITASLEIQTDSLKIETSEERPQETTDEKVLDERKPSNEITASLEIPTESLKIETSEERPQETTDEKVLDERKPSNEITTPLEIQTDSLKIETSEERPQETTDEKVLDERKPSNEITTPLEIQTDSLKIETSEERPQETTDEKVLDERKPSNEITASLEIPTESLKIETSEERPQETTDEKVLDERKPSNEITASLEIPTESLKIETSEERPQETTDEKVLDERKPSNEITASLEIPTESLKIETSEERPQETTDEKVLDERKPSNEITASLEIPTESLRIETIDTQVLCEEITLNKIPTELLKVQLFVDSLNESHVNDFLKQSSVEPNEVSSQYVTFKNMVEPERMTSVHIPPESSKIESFENTIFEEERAERDPTLVSEQSFVEGTCDKNAKYQEPINDFITSFDLSQNAMSTGNAIDDLANLYTSNNSIYPEQSILLSNPLVDKVQKNSLMMDHFDVDAHPSSVNSLISESSGVYSADMDGYRLPAKNRFQLTDDAHYFEDKDDITLVNMEEADKVTEPKIEAPNVNKRQFVEDWAAIHTTLQPDLTQTESRTDDEQKISLAKNAFSLYSLPLFTLATSTVPCVPNILSTNPNEEERHPEDLPLNQFSYSCDSLDKLPSSSVFEINDPTSLLSELTAADDLRDDVDNIEDEQSLRNSLDRPRRTLPRSSTPLSTHDSQKVVSNLPKIYKSRDRVSFSQSDIDIETCLVKPFDSSTSYSDYVCVIPSIEEEPIVMQGQEVMEALPAFQPLKVDVTPEYVRSPLIGKRDFMFDSSCSLKSSPAESYLHEEDIGLPEFVANIQECLGRLSEITELINRPSPAINSEHDKDGGNVVIGNKIVRCLPFFQRRR